MFKSLVKTHLASWKGCNLVSYIRKYSFYKYFDLMTKNLTWCNIKYELGQYFQNIFQGNVFLIHENQGFVLELQHLKCLFIKRSKYEVHFFQGILMSSPLMLFLSHDCKMASFILVKPQWLSNCQLFLWIVIYIVLSITPCFICNEAEVLFCFEFICFSFYFEYFHLWKWQ